MGLALLPGGEAVAEPEMGMDEAPSGDSGLELLAQLPDVDVDRAVGLAVGLAPDLAVELLARDDAVAPKATVPAVNWATPPPEPMPW